MTHASITRLPAHRASPLSAIVESPAGLIATLTLPQKRATVSPLPHTASRRGTLRDLYTFGLVSVFRRHSILRVWEPLRETPRVTSHYQE